MNVFLTEQFRRDLESIWDFLGASSPEAADRVTDELITRALRIGEAPEAAAILPRFAAVEVRRVLVRRWAIYYRIEGDAVVALRVVHGGRDIGQLSL